MKAKIGGWVASSVDLIRCHILLVSDMGLQTLHCLHRPASVSLRIQKGHGKDFEKGYFLRMYVNKKST